MALLVVLVVVVVVYPLLVADGLSVASEKVQLLQYRSSRSRRSSRSSRSNRSNRSNVAFVTAERAEPPKKLLAKISTGTKTHQNVKRWRPQRHSASESHHK